MASKAASPPPRAARPPAYPASTSPNPARAAALQASRSCHRRPSPVAITVRAPLSSTLQGWQLLHCRAAAWAARRAGASASSGKRRANSPRCGVIQVGPWRPFSQGVAPRRASRLSPSASSSSRPGEALQRLPDACFGSRFRLRGGTEPWTQHHRIQPLQGCCGVQIGEIEAAAGV